MPRYDLHFQALTSDEQLESTKIMTFGYAETLGVKGFQLLINLWLKLLFTRKGSDPTNLDRGTAITNLIGSNTSPQDAEDVVRIAIDDANSQLRAIQNLDTTYTDSERLDDARLYRFAADSTAPGIEFWVEIKNQAGKRILVNIPDFAKG